MTTCWACGKSIAKTETECPYCGMPLTEENSTDDIDSFLDSTEISDNLDIDDLLDEDSQADLDDMPVMPEVADELMDTDIPVMPEVADELMDTDMPVMPEVADDLMDIDMPVMPEVADDLMDTDMPSMPDIDMDLMYAEEGVTEEEESITKVVEESKIGIKKWIRIYLPQWIYWIIVFDILVFTQYKIIDPNSNPLNIIYYGDSSSINYNTGMFLFLWLFFIPMGFHFGYTLYKRDISRNIINMVIYQIGFLISMLLFNYLIIFILNPKIIYGQLSYKNYILTTFLKLGITNYILGFLSMGFFLFYLFYKPYYHFIYNLTPVGRSELLENE